MSNIDFVVTWVDGGDPKWLAKKKLFDKSIQIDESMNASKNYRPGNNFKYWFRAVEKNAPWVHKIYLVTDDQVPEWLNLAHPKIEVIDHKQIFPQDALPTFNSNAIDINLYKIPGLSEQFVYFNDDIYITNSTTSEDFFKNNLPCDIAQLNPIVAVRGGTGNFQVNDMMVINEHFTKKELLKNGKMLSLKNGLKAVIRTGLQLPSKFTCGFFDPHLPLSFLKSTFEEIQNISQDELKATTYSRFRDARNVSVWLMRYWQLATGKFFIRNNEKLGKFYSLADDKQAEVWATFESKLPKVMCINDSANISNPDATDKKLSEYLDNIFPEKSSYEK